MPQLECISPEDIKAKHMLTKRIIDLSISYGDFTLKSGAKSHYYLDLRKTMLDSRGLQAAAHLIAGICFANRVDAVGGVELGAVPIVAGVIAIKSRLPMDVRGFIIRKQAKEHGTQQLIEGLVEPGNHVIIVEDVITSGGSTITAVKAAKEFGLNVLGVIAVMDRLQGGHNAIQKHCPIKTILTISDLRINPPPEECNSQESENSEEEE